MGELMSKYMWYERHKEVISDSKKYVIEIANRYKRTYSYYLFKNHRKNLSSTGQSQEFLLEQRKWESYNRPLLSGNAYVLGGNDLKKWQRVYCVLQPRYNIEVYGSEKDFEAAHRPTLSLQHGIYDVVENVDGHFTQLIKDYMRDFGYVVENVSTVSSRIGSAADPSRRPTQHVLSLYHNYRGTFYMAFDSALEKDKWLEYLHDAQRHLTGVHCENATKRSAFESAIKQMCDAEEHCNLQIKIAGTQEEIITDFITAYLSNGCKTMLKTKVKGDIVKKFKMWGNISKTLIATVESVVKEDYPRLCENAEAEAEAQQQQIVSSMAQINSTYDSASGIINDDLGDSWLDELEGRILPKIPDTVEKMRASMLAPVAEVKSVFVCLMHGVEHHTTSTSTEFANNIDKFFLNHMDVTPRTPETMQSVFTASSGNKSPLKDLLELFPKLNVAEYEGELCKLMQKLLDSAIATFQVLCGDTVSKSDGRLEKTAIENIKARVLKRYTHDSIVLTRRFITRVLNSAVYKTLKPIAYQDIKNKMHRYEELIPQEYFDFLLASCLFGDVIQEKLENFLNEHINATWNQSSPVNGDIDKEGPTGDDKTESKIASQNGLSASNSEHTSNNVTQNLAEDVPVDQNAVNCVQDSETGECVGDSDATEKPVAVTNGAENNKTDGQTPMQNDEYLVCSPAMNEPASDNKDSNKEPIEESSADTPSEGHTVNTKSSSDKGSQDENGVAIQSPSNTEVQNTTSCKQSCAEAVSPSDPVNVPAENDSLHVNGHKENAL